MMLLKLNMKFFQLFQIQQINSSEFNKKNSYCYFKNSEWNYLNLLGNFLQILKKNEWNYVKRNRNLFYNSFKNWMKLSKL